MLFSVITVMLYLNVDPNSSLMSYDIQIGGLNETELFDLKQIWQFPDDSAVEAYGAWSVNFLVERKYGPGEAKIRMSSPPINAVAPFLSCIKSWGYKITFYNSYAGDIQDGNEQTKNTIPLMSHTWVLENHNESITTSKQFTASSSKVLHIISTETSSSSSREPTSTFPTQNTDTTDSNSSLSNLLFSRREFLFWTCLTICTLLVRDYLYIL